MSKLTVKQKIEIYEKRQEGKTITSLSQEYNVRGDNLIYLIRLIKRHGYSVVERQNNRYYPPDLKEEIINKVLIDGKSRTETSLEYGLSSTGILFNWIKKYKEANYVIVEKSKGRRSTMKKEIKKYEDMTSEEKVQHLETKNLYLEAENEYLKKLRAVIQNRKNPQQKKK
jgi:transposase